MGVFHLLILYTINTILYHRPLLHSIQDHEEKYYRRFWKYNDELWDKIMELAEPFFYNYDGCYFCPLIDSIYYNMENKDFRMAALVEIGNMCGEKRIMSCFNKAYNYLSKILSKIDPDIALTCIIKYLQTFCYIENDEYIPDFYTCLDGRGAILILLRLLTEIKGGEISKRIEAKKLFKSFCAELDELEKNDFDNDV